MPKNFECARITPNDDGTFSIGVTLPPKKGKGGEMGYYDREKTFTAGSIEEALSKIKKYGGGKSDLDDFMKPRMGKDDEDDEENY